MVGTVVPIDAASADEKPAPGFCSGAGDGFSVQAARKVNVTVKKTAQTVANLISQPQLFPFVY
jgi:hypothetical protein